MEILELLGQSGRRGAAGQRAEFPGQVSLVSSRAASGRSWAAGQRVHHAHRVRDHPVLPGHGRSRAGWTVLLWATALPAIVLAAAGFLLRRPGRARRAGAAVRRAPIA
jgi:hypothetical protein